MNNQISGKWIKLEKLVNWLFEEMVNQWNDCLLDWFQVSWPASLDDE